MRALTTAEMLDVWESALSRSPLERSLMLLSAAAEPGEPIARLSAGQRDDRLLSLREWAFGADFTAVANCPNCRERLDLSFHTSDVRVGAVSETAARRPLDVSGYSLRCRPPNSLDLLAIAAERDHFEARRQLLERCLSDVTREGTAITLEQLPADVVNAAVELMAEADPQGDVQIDLNCPECGNQWRASFDIGPYFWSEINSWAQRILHEVHTLASTYGWSESEILSLSPWRRQFYLSCVST